MNILPYSKLAVPSYQNNHASFFMTGCPPGVKVEEEPQKMSFMLAASTFCREFRGAITAWHNGKEIGTLVEGEAYWERVFQYEQAFHNLSSKGRK